MSKSARKLRINTAIEGELSEWVLTWQRRGLVKSVSDAVRQALIALHERFQAMDERTARLQSMAEQADEGERVE